MTKRRKLILCLVAILTVLLMAGAAVLALQFGTANSFSVQIERGQKYLDDGDFDNAVLCYQRAIKANPGQAEGYIGLSQAYMGLEKSSLAQSVLEKGLGQTQSARIQLMIEKYFGGDTVYTAENAVQIELPPGVEANELDFVLLENIARFTYNDYRLEQGIVSESDKETGYLVETAYLLLLFY